MRWKLFLSKSKTKWLDWGFAWRLDMIIPDKESDREEFLSWVLATCRLSIDDRREFYDRRRQFFLHGTATDNEAIYNRLESHIDLVSSFLYSPDHAEFAL